VAFFAHVAGFPKTINHQPSTTYRFSATGVDTLRLSILIQLTR